MKAIFREIGYDDTGLFYLAMADFVNAAMNIRVAL
jgi:hypothetical protein